MAGMAASDEAVMFTGTDAAISKLSCARKRYTDDPFIELFIEPSKRHLKRAPLINRGYFARTCAVDKLVINFLKSSSDAAQIVTLGAGNDTLFFRLRSKFPALAQKLVVFETDFDPVIERKRQLIASHSELSALADDDRYRTFGCDLRDINQFASRMMSAGFNADIPTLFLSECVLIYMETQHSNAIINWAADNTRAGGVFVTYEQILPHDPFGAMMVRNIASRGCPLRSISKYPDMMSLKARYESLGWTNTHVRDMNDVYYNFIEKSEVSRIQRLEIFDELEEWHLIQGHYCISVAVNEASETRRVSTTLDHDLAYSLDYK